MSAEDTKGDVKAEGKEQHINVKVVSQVSTVFDDNDGELS